MSKHISYRVSLKDSLGCSFAPSDYSQYDSRLSKKLLGLLPKNEEVYGLAQAKAHIKELRNHIWDGKKIYKNREFVVTKEVTIARVVHSE